MSINIITLIVWTVLIKSLPLSNHALPIKVLNACWWNSAKPLLFYCYTVPALELLIKEK